MSSPSESPSESPSLSPSASESPSESPSLSPSPSESPSESPSPSFSDEPLEEDAYVLDYAIQVKGSDSEAPGATTQYSNYTFNSMVKFGDKYIGANASGIFELDGDDDNGVNIDAYFEPIMTDFGIRNPKRVRFMYLKYEAEGDLLIDLSADEGPEQSISVDSTKTRQQRRRVPGVRNIQGRWFMFRISNVNGCDFGFDAMNVDLTVMPEGLTMSM